MLAQLLSGPRPSIVRVRPLTHSCERLRSWAVRNLSLQVASLESVESQRVQLCSFVPGLMPLSPSETLKERRGGELGASWGLGWQSLHTGVEVRTLGPGWQSLHTVTRDMLP